MKKISSSVLIVFIILLMSACGNANTPATSDLSSVSSIIITGLVGEGTELNPYQLFVGENETKSIDLTLMSLQATNYNSDNENLNISFSEVQLSRNGYIEIDDLLPHGLDLSSSLGTNLVVTGLVIGTHFIKISISEEVYTIIEVKVKLNRESNFSNTLKILAVGNSFSVDAMEYLYKIADDYGIDEIVLGILYIPGAALETHVQSIDRDYSNYIYYKNTDDIWTNTPGTKLIEGLTDEDWDIITVQQVSGSSGLPDTYNKDLDTLLDFIYNNMTNAATKVVWHMTWAYQQNASHPSFPNYNSNQMTMYNAIVNTVSSEIDTRNDIEYVIPSGTTIQNLRTSYIGDYLTIDGYHLSRDKGRLAAALTWFSKITGFPIDNITYRPQSVTIQDLENIKEAVLNAINDPYQVTASTFTEKDIVDPDTNTDPIISAGELEINFVTGFWNSTGSHSLIDGDAISVNYIAPDKRYTKEEIPIGSIITIEVGYQYRANFWTTLDGPLSEGRRTDNITTTRIVVDEAWWGTQEYVSFNVSELGTPNISNRIAEVASKFIVLLPIIPE